MNLSKPQKILLVAEMLTTLGRTPFDRNVLIVETWKQYPDTFGIHGYESIYPDSNMVISLLSGKARGLIGGHKWLKKTAANTYEVTPLGRKHAWKLGQAVTDGDDKALRQQIHRTATEIFLDRLAKTKAYHWDVRGTRQRIDFTDALDFIGDANITDMQQRLAEIGESASPRAAEARALRHLADWLAERFRVQFATMGTIRKKVGA
jgi:hypothetical protein